MGLKLVFNFVFISFHELSILEKVWPFVENVGVPILAFIGVLTFGSFMFYLNDIKNLRLMEKQLKLNGTLRNYRYQTLPIIGLREIFYAFKSLSSIELTYLRNKKFQEQVYTVRAYRQYYKVAIPTILALATIGIAINEMVIDY